MAADELGDNVAMFPGISPNKYDPEVRLKSALRAGLTEVIIIGWDEDGELFFSASNGSGPECLWLIEKAKLALLNVGEE